METEKKTCDPNRRCDGPQCLCSDSPTRHHRRISITGHLDVRSVPVLQRLFLSLLAGGPPRVSLDLTAVTGSDSVGVALVVLMIRTALRRGLVLEGLAFSPAMADMMEFFHLGKLVRGG